MRGLRSWMRCGTRGAGEVSVTTGTDTGTSPGTSSIPGTSSGTDCGAGTGTIPGTSRRITWSATTGNWSLDPSGDWYCWWLSLMVLPVLYNWIVLICRSCFPEVQRQHQKLWWGLDGLGDFLYVMDIGVHLHTAFLEDGLLVVDPCRLRRRYLLSSSFWWHVASVAPSQLLHGSPLARANRCLRAPRLLEAFHLLETRAGHPERFRVAKLMLYVFLAIHGHACLYFALSDHLGLGSDPWVCPNSSRPLRLYLHSFYISTLVLATVGDTPEPRRLQEFLFLTFGFLLAVLGFATVTGSVASVLSNVAQADAALSPAPGPALRLLRARGAGAGLRWRVARWHGHLREQRKPLAEERALRALPRALRAQLQAEVHLPALRRVQLFRGWHEQLLRQLVPRLRPQVLGPGELVCRRGDVGREMFFIQEGRLAVMAEDGRTRLAVLGQGLYFGEISLINIRGNTSGNRRTADIVSIGYSDLFCLAKEDLMEVLAEFPSARATLEARGRQLLLAMGKLDLQAEAKAVAEEEEAEQRLQELEGALEELQRQAARILAQLEASAHKLAIRVQRLEGRHQGKQPAGGQGPAGAQGPPMVQGPSEAEGPTGALGPSMVQGPSEAEGPTGALGPPMVQGPSGAEGPTGAQALSGVRGPCQGKGPTKAQGPRGVQRPPRAQGAPRAQGPSGLEGPRGVRGPSRGDRGRGMRGTRP